MKFRQANTVHNDQEIVKQLRSSIGTQVHYNGIRCSVVELLEDPTCLVLQALETRSTIQDNQFGTPQRRVTQVFTIPCFSEITDGRLHDELLSLDLPLK